MYCSDSPLRLNLVAEFEDELFKRTTTYNVQQIQYPSPYPFTGGTSLNITVDDLWSDVFILPFDFCFFNQKYNTGKISSNGMIGFNVPVNDFDAPYEIPGMIPNNTFPAEIRGAIYGVFQDIDPSINLDGYNTSINYQVVGEYPCRALVVNFFEVPLYNESLGCANRFPGQTYQIVLYEITNIIDVYIGRRDSCAAMEDGRGLVGIMNTAGTLAYSPPNRNTGSWHAQNEAWRFSPSGEQAYEFGWYVNGVKVSDQLNATVNLNNDATIEARVTFTDCTELILSKDYRIDFIENIDGKDIQDLVVCKLDEDDPSDTYDPIDLTENEVKINRYAVIPSDLQYSYYLDFNSADTGVNPIRNQRNFSPLNLPTNIYVRVYDKQSECHKVLQFKLIEDDYEFKEFEDDIQCFSFVLPTLENNETYDKIEVLSSSKGSITRTMENVKVGDVLLKGNYKIYIKVKSPEECEMTRSYFLDVLECIFPKGISPNNDGLNDLLDLTGFKTSEISIYNRYGKLVYSKKNYTNEWDGKDNQGKDLPTGTYFVKARTYVKDFYEWVQLVRED